MNTLFYILYPGDVVASRHELVRHGFPEEHLLKRDLRNRIRKAVGEAEDWSISGPATGMLLSYKTNQMGTISVMGEEWTFEPDMAGFAQSGGRITPAQVRDWLQKARDYYGDALAGIDIRRAMENRLRGIGAVDAPVPSLWEVPSEVFPLVQETAGILRSCCSSESGEVHFGYWEVASQAPLAKPRVLEDSFQAGGVNVTAERKICGATKADGTICKGMPTNATGFCRPHSHWRKNTPL